MVYWTDDMTEVMHDTTLERVCNTHSSSVNISFWIQNKLGGTILLQ